MSFSIGSGVSFEDVFISLEAFSFSDFGGETFVIILEMQRMGRALAHGSATMFF